MTTFFSFAFLAASVFGKMIALPMSMLAIHVCMHDSQYGVGKEFPQHSTQKVFTISHGTRMELVGILWGTGGEPGMFFGEPGFGGGLEP